MVSTFPAVDALSVLADCHVDGLQLLGLTRLADSALSKEAFTMLAKSRYGSTKVPLNLAQWAKELRAELGPVVGETRWFGSGGFSRAVRSLELSNMEIADGCLWDTTRHKRPTKA